MTLAPTTQVSEGKLQPPADWMATAKIEILEATGWYLDYPSFGVHPKDFDEPITYEEFRIRLRLSMTAGR